jgi:hypothetical protein
LRTWASELQTRIDGLYFIAWHAKKGASIEPKCGEQAPTHEHTDADGSTYSHSHADGSATHTHDDDGSAVSFGDLLKRASKVASSIPQQVSAHNRALFVPFERVASRSGCTR